MPEEQITMTITGPDGVTTPPFTMDQLESALGEIKGSKRVPMKETEADKKVANDAYNVTADELRQFVERFEQLESEKVDVAEQQKELMAEAKGRGYDTKIMKKIVAMRKRKPDELAEEDAVLELYKQALGMN